MKFGDIFKSIIGEDSARMDIQMIESKAIKKTLFKRYGKNISGGQNNIFENKLFDTSKIFDKKLSAHI